MTGSQESTLLRGATIVDGTGGDPYSGDIAIRDGVITAIHHGDSDSVEIAGFSRVLDCEGNVVSPGFVDIHTHSDLTIRRYPGNESRVTQGVTTEVVGNCGMTPAPTGGDEAGLASVIGTIDLLREPNWPWTDVEGWLGSLAETPAATNMAALVGHGSARFVAAGPRSAPLTEEQSIALGHELERALDAGVVGVSLGLMYAPGEGADANELMNVGRIVAAHDALLTVHLRDYAGENLHDSVLEVLDVARVSGARLQISHLRRVGNQGDYERVIESIDRARADVDVAADVYPYIAGHTNLIQILPSEVRGLGAVAVTALCVSDPRAIAGMLRDSGYSPEQFLLMKVPNSPELTGANLAELAEDPWELLVDLLIENECLVDVAVSSGNWSDVETALRTPWVSIGSDGTALSADHSASMAHPRSWGAFPAAFERMRTLGISTQEAVRRMTGQPASRVGLSSRIAVGERADLTVFNPKSLGSDASYAEPAVRARGIHHVFVGGVSVLDSGKTTDKRPGQLLRGGNCA